MYACPCVHCRSGGDVMYEDQVYLNSQNGTQRLDKFTHCLLVKCSLEVSLPNSSRAFFIQTHEIVHHAYYFLICNIYVIVTKWSHLTLLKYY